MALDSTIRLRLQVAEKGTPEIGQALFKLDEIFSNVLESGTSSGKADRFYQDDFSIAGSGSTNYDLAGSLTGGLGAAAVFAKVKAIVLVASPGNVNSIVVGNGTAPFVGPFGAGTESVSIPPGGLLMLTAPAAGWSVTATTGDILKLANSSSGTAVAGKLFVIGTSA